MSKRSADRVADILDVAEAGMRRGGFDAISFRDIADAVGIKSASVHYHFPHKTDLGRAVVARYADRFLAGLGAPDSPGDSAADRIARLTAAYRAALTEDQATCLCAVLGAVSGGLAPEIAAAVEDFFQRAIAWAAAALGGGPDAESRAAQIVATLQGAMILAVALDRPDVLKDAEERILAAFAAVPD